MKHPEEVLGVPFLSDDYAVKVLQPGVLVTCGAPAFVHSSNYLLFADGPPGVIGSLDGLPREPLQKI